MEEVIYNPPELKKAAEALAEATPQHLGRPTTPIIRWRVDGDQLRVLLADGRTVRGPLPDKKAHKPQLAGPHRQLMALPVHAKDATVDPAQRRVTRPVRNSQVSHAARTGHRKELISHNHNSCSVTSTHSSPAHLS